MTQKEYTGPEFEIEFARADYEWKKGGKVGPNPCRNWEYRTIRGWENGCLGMDFGNESAYLFRWKPAQKRTITIGYESHDGAEWISKTLVAPEVEAPEFDATVFYFTLEGISIALNWRGIERQVMLLNSGQIFLTREDAQAMSDWIAVCRKGGQS